MRTVLHRQITWVGRVANGRGVPCYKPSFVMAAVRITNFFRFTVSQIVSLMHVPLRNRADCISFSFFFGLNRSFILAVCQSRVASVALTQRNVVWSYSQRELQATAT